MRVKSILKMAIPAALAMLLILVGCSTKETNPTAGNSTTGVSSSDNQRHKPAWVTPALNGDQVSVPLSAIQENKMVHFWVNLPSGKEAFMAYTLDGVTYMRADICPPCRSYSFSLQKGVLVCDTCGTKFEAGTGKGINGPCVNYPKEAVAWQLDNGNLVATESDLKAAYEKTLQPG
jgi:nitrite reductase/ring-hydroxylating ferredoxin subunit